MREASMSGIGILGIDLAKGSFQVCGVKADGVAVFNRSISRLRPYQLLAEQPHCVVAMEEGLCDLTSLGSGCPVTRP